MKTTYLYELVKEQFISDDGVEFVTLKRLPMGNELIAIHSEGWTYSEELNLPKPCKLQLLGKHPLDPFSVICARANCGLFWYCVVTLKYRIWKILHWLKLGLFRQLYMLGMMFCPIGEKPDWRHLKLDWLLIACAIASVGLFACTSLWLQKADYWEAAFSLLIALCGFSTTFWRKNWLVLERDRELAKIHSGGTVTVRINDYLIEGSSLDRIIKIIENHQANTCRYYDNNEFLSCAVHPEKQALGECGKNCPSFVAKS